MPHSRLRADVDTWGFPPLAPEAFLHGTGTANIVEVARISEKSFHMKGSNNRPVGRPRKAIRKSDEEATLSSEAIFHSKHTKSGMEGSLHYNLTQYPPEINTPDPQLLEATQISYFEGPLGSIHGDQQTVRSLSKRKRVQLSSQDEGRALKRVRHDLVVSEMH